MITDLQERVVIRIRLEILNTIRKEANKYDNKADKELILSIYKIVEEMRFG